MGGAIAALNHVVENGGIAGNMAGGTHHAHYDFGSGYCIFNDLAVCALMALQEHNYESGNIRSRCSSGRWDCNNPTE